MSRTIVYSLGIKSNDFTKQLEKINNLIAESKKNAENLGNIFSNIGGGSLTKFNTDLAKYEQQIKSILALTKELSKANNAIKPVSSSSSSSSSSGGSSETPKATDVEKLAKAFQDLAAAEENVKKVNLDDEFASTKVQIAETSKSISTLQKLLLTYNASQEGQDQITAELAKQETTIEEVSERYSELVTESVRLRTEYSQLQKNIKLTQESFRQTADSIPSDSLKALRQDAKLLAAEWENLGAAQREGTNGQELQNELKAIRDQILEADKAVGNFSSNVGNYTNSIIEALSGSRDFKKAIESIAEVGGIDQVFKDIDKGSEGATETLKGFIKQLRSVNGDLLDTETGLEDYEKSMSAVSKRQETLGRQLQQLQEEWKELPKNIKNSADAQDLYDKRVNRLRESIDQLADVTGKTSKDFEDGFLKSLKNSGGVLGSAAGNVSDFGESLKALSRNPVLGFLGLAAAALTTLFSLFSKTQKGTELLSKGQAALNGIFQTAVGLTDSLVTSLTSFASDPLKGIEDLGKAIVDNILNRFRAVGDLVTGVGDLMTAFFNKDVDGFSKASEKLRTGIAQIATGLDKESQDGLVNGLKRATEAAQENIDKNVVLDESRRAIARSNALLQKEVEALITLEEKLNVTAGNSTLSFKEREEAAEQARSTLEARAQKEIEIAENNLSLIDQEIAQRQKNNLEIDSLLDTQLGAFQALATAERDYTLSVQSNEKERAELKQDRLERDLDFLIDGLNNQIGLNERAINNDLSTLKEKEAIFATTKKISEDSFQEQIAIIKQFTDEQFDLNELVQIQDQEILREKVRALGTSEIIEGRLLEIIRDRRDITEQLTDLERTLIQAREDAEVAGINAAKNASIIELVSDPNLSNQQIADKRVEIELEAERKIAEIAAQSQLKTAEEKAAAELETQEKIRAIREAANNTSFNEALATIEREKQAKIAAAIELARVESENAGKDTEKIEQAEIAFQERLKDIELKADKDILDAKIESQIISQDESLALINEQNQKELDADAEKKAKLIDNEKKFRQEAFEIAQIALSSLSNTLNGVNEIQNNRDAARIEQIEERYEAEIEAAEGNNERIVELEAERDAEVEAIQREQFERGQRLAVATALISGAQAVLSVLASVPGPLDILSLGIARIAQIAATVVATGVQIAAIKSQTFQDGGVLSIKKGGKAKGRSHSGGGIQMYSAGSPTGLEIEGDEIVLTRQASQGKSSKIASYLNSIAGGKDFDSGLNIGERAAIDNIINSKPLPTPQLVRPVLIKEGNNKLEKEIQLLRSELKEANQKNIQNRSSELAALRANNEKLMKEQVKIQERLKRQEKRSTI